MGRSPITGAPHVCDATALGPHDVATTEPGAERLVLSVLKQAISDREYWSANSTWRLIPLSKWVITPVINGISRVNPLITGVITHLLSGMSHQVGETKNPNISPSKTNEYTGSMKRG